MSDPVLALTVGHAFVDVGRSFREGFLMFWETLWPLVLGFGLSGAIQAFVSHEQMERTLGDHQPAAFGSSQRLRDGVVFLLVCRVGNGQLFVRQRRWTEIDVARGDITSDGQGNYFCWPTVGCRPGDQPGHPGREAVAARTAVHL